MTHFLHIRSVNLKYHRNSLSHSSGNTPTGEARRLCTDLTFTSLSYTEPPRTKRAIGWVCAHTPTSVAAEDLLVHDGGNGQAVEAVGEGLPQLDVEPAFTCVEEEEEMW